MAQRKVHYNIRHVSAGKPVAYCHAVCETHEVSLHTREVTCDICCDFIDSFAVAVGKKPGVERTSSGHFNIALLIGFIAVASAASAYLWQRFM
ncbi:MAG TPA: hypothetical protein VL371_16135 [Gemmataceae bacterium]|nr:hypothetical protein [Gemmataceae bacterium]